MIKNGTDYRSVAVIGGQSSGKSTLLNLLFESKFQEMDQLKGRSQTTKGIWLARNHSAKILVFDIEGTDSKERGDQRLTFAQTTSLFALFISDVLIINMWTHDVGKHEAANYSLLERIFEVNLKLREQHFSKKLLFVLRDFDPSTGNFESMTSELEKDINTIWDKIYKPAEYAKTKAADFFKFEFEALPHKNYQKEEFYAKAKALKERFEVTAGNSLFVSDEAQNNLPIDALPRFVENAWDTIRNNKEFNLPDQRAMVANYRCNEIK